MNTGTKLFIGAVLSVSLTGCFDDNTSNKDIQAQKAAAAAQQIQFSENAEIENIKRRLELTANPGLNGFVILLNQMGQPVMYTGVKGKVTSGGKKLTPTQELKCHSSGCNVMTSASDEGTHGSSGEYIFFWTQNDQYIQWNGGYLYSDKPFRLTQDPLVVNIK